ncbi:hypothetical protein LACDD01_00011 [Lactococcus sp. DD01]|nr:hypothetical protein LACDD01_00011 [Lactococcus sp. DD01]
MQWGGLVFNKLIRNFFIGKNINPWENDKEKVSFDYDEVKQRCT